MKRTLTFLALLLFKFSASVSQGEIPVGTWRANLAYNKIICVAVADDVIYGASEMGIVIFNKSDQSFSTLNKLNGLSSSGITWIAFNHDTKQLVVTYEDGNLDVIEDNAVHNFTRLKELSNVVGSKRLNHCITYNNWAYISTDYGIVVFDLNTNELKETWRDLGERGTQIRILQTTIQNDSIYAATSNGIIAGNLNDNLLDFHNWKRFTTGELNDEVESITTFKGHIYAAVSGVGIFSSATDSFVKTDFLTGAEISSLQASSAGLSIVANENLYLLHPDLQLIQIADDVISIPLIAQTDSDGVFWVGDTSNGLVSNISGTFESYLPNGPSIEQAFGLRSIDNSLYAFNGGFNSAAQSPGVVSVVNIMTNGIWSEKPSTLRDITDIRSFNNRLYTASFGDGLLQEDNGTGTATLFDHTNSPLINSSVSGKSVKIPSIFSGFSGLWVANFDAMPSLHLLKTDNSWQSFSSNILQARYPIAIVEDHFGNVWMAINPVHGAGVVVFDMANNSSILKTDVPGAGGLLNRSARCLAVDRDGYVWVGTDAGLGYFYSPSEDAVIPIFDNRYLLKDEEIADIEVDGANRKWVATEHGAWLFSGSGEEQIYHLTEENSPLLSDNVVDIEINHGTGEIFFATDKGIVSFRGDATTGANDFSSIKIFPNPVTPNFNGTIGISGLMSDALVKITDTSGKLIWQVQAQGGTAVWNIRDYNGNRASSGIYLVFAATQDGSESVVGKIAVIE